MKGLNILVVDDEPDLAELVSFEFELVGANVKTAKDGIEGYALSQEENFDVVVSDIRMPNGDGIGMLKKIREQGPIHPVVLMMTGYADITLEEAYHLGAGAVFGKPFNRKDLIATVTRTVTPPSKRWKTAAEQTSEIKKISMSLPSLEKASEQKLFSLGHGGFFLHIKENWPNVSDSIQFEINLEDSEVPLIQGHGVVKWVRSKEGVAEQKGIGVELHGLDENCLANIVDYILKHKISSYIPKE